MAICQKFFEVLYGSVSRIYGILIRNIVLMIRCAGMDRHEPNTRDPQFLQVIQLGSDTLQISDPITVGITEGIDKDLIPGTIMIVGALPQSCDPIYLFFYRGTTAT